MITPNIVTQIHTMHNTGKYTNKAIADLFRIHPDTVSNILKIDEDKDFYIHIKNLDIRRDLK